MHPSELKNQALTAAVAAELEGFQHTAEALRVLALSFVRPNEDLWQLVNEQTQARALGTFTLR